MMETRIQYLIIEAPNGRAFLERALKVDGDSLMSSMCVVRPDEHAAVHDCEDADLVALDLGDDAVGIAPHLTEAAGVLRVVECRLNLGLRLVNTECAVTRGHGEGWELVGPDCP